MRRHSEIAVASKKGRLHVQISDFSIPKGTVTGITYGLTKSLHFLIFCGLLEKGRLGPLWRWRACRSKMEGMLMIWDPARNVEACHDHGGWPWVFLQCVDLMSNLKKK